MFNSLIGRSSSGSIGIGGKDTQNNAEGGVTFGEVDATLDFKNQLRPPRAAATITQQQVDEGLTLPPAAQLLGGGQQAQPPPPPPPPPQQVGVGGIRGG